MESDVNAPVKDLVVVSRPQKEVRVVTDPIPVLDTARFEHMQRVATVMTNSSLIPESLCTDKNGEILSNTQVSANCFLVVNQAVRWGMDPFAVAQCVSVVHGKLCYEGKLIAAVIATKLGIQLKYEWDDKPGDNLGIVVSGRLPGESELRTVEGTVGEWKTTGKGTPWVGAQSRKMLAYRGAREWGRLHAPALMLGVYSEDELSALSDERRFTRARDVTPRGEADDGPPPPDEVGTGTEPEHADLEVVESGRTEPGDVVWEDPPAPEETTTADPKLKQQLLDLIAKLNTAEDIARLVGDRDFYTSKAKLTKDDEFEVDRAFLNRQREIMSQKAK